jgi:hypothetical protein
VIDLRSPPIAHERIAPTQSRPTLLAEHRAAPHRVR